MKASKIFLSSIVFISIACILLTPTASLAKIHKLTILHTNDHSGHFMKFSWQGTPDVGGMAARSTLVNIVRAEVEQAGGHVLLLSAGGVNMGTPESDLLRAEPDFTLMKMLGYDAMTLGIHDFNLPHEVLMQQREWAGFPFLSANIVKKETGEPLLDPYIITTFDDFEVAVFGLTYEKTPKIIVRYRKDLESRNSIEIAKALVPKLRAEADLVIALTYIGFDEGSRETCDVQVARAVPGIDVIVGGYSGIALEELAVIGNTLIVQAGKYGLYVGRLDLTIDSDTNTITDSAYQLMSVNLKQKITYQDRPYYRYIDKGYVEDPDVLDVTSSYLAQVHDVLSEPVGETLVRLDGAWELVTSQETNLANLVTDSMRAKTGAEIAFTTAGTIFIDANIKPGPLTYRDILDILPWNPRLVLLDMTGAQVLEVLNYAATFDPGGHFLHVSGLSWTKKKGVAEDVLVAGSPIDPNRIYKVVTTNYLTEGGDGHTTFKECPQFDTGFTDASALREYIMKLGTVEPKEEGRLTIIE